MVINIYERNVNETLNNRHTKFRLIDKGYIDVDTYDAKTIIKNLRKNDFISSNLLLCNSETGECDLELMINSKHFKNMKEAIKWLKPRCRDLVLSDDDMMQSLRYRRIEKRVYR